MPWVKLDDGFFDNPKMRAAGKDGRALQLAALCHSAAQLLDGEIAFSLTTLLSAKAEVRRQLPVIAHLVEINAWHVEGHDCDRCPPCKPDTYIIHDYLEFQPSGAQERERRREVSEVKSRAGRLGAAKRWGDGKPDSTAMANPIAQPWHSDSPDPEPEPPEVLSTTAAAVTANLRHERLAAAAEIIGERAAQRPGTRNPASTRNAVARGVIAGRHADAYAIIAATPSITPADLAERLEPTPEPAPQPYNPSSHIKLVEDAMPKGEQHWELGADACADIREQRGWEKAPAAVPQNGTTP